MKGGKIFACGQNQWQWQKEENRKQSHGTISTSKLNKSKMCRFSSVTSVAISMEIRNSFVFTMTIDVNIKQHAMLQFVRAEDSKHKEKKNQKEELAKRKKYLQ